MSSGGEINSLFEKNLHIIRNIISHSLTGGLVMAESLPHSLYIFSIFSTQYIQPYEWYIYRLRILILNPTRNLNPNTIESLDLNLIKNLNPNPR